MMMIIVMTIDDDDGDDDDDNDGQLEEKYMLSSVRSYKFCLPVVKSVRCVFCVEHF